jgi:pimeloyl-ACP methyl ester carboxylesterase
MLSDPGANSALSPEDLPSDLFVQGTHLHASGYTLLNPGSRDAVLADAAAARPGAFCSLTLLGSGPGAIDGQRAAMLRDVLSLLEPADGDPGRMADLVRQAWQQVHEPQARAEGTPGDIIAFLRERTLRTCPVSLIVLAKYLLHSPDRTDDLAALVAAGLPAAVVYGENDDAWPPAEQSLMASRLGAERTCIPGAAHSPAIEAPVTTASTLTAFWNAAERRRPTVHTCDRHRDAGNPAAARAI